MFLLFPSLLTYEQLVPVLLRLTLGLVFVLWAYDSFKKRDMGKKRNLVILEGVVGIALIVGFLTQLAALVCAIILGYELFGKIKAKAFLTNGVNYFLILFIIAICVLVSGAGFIAFDLPL